MVFGVPLGPAINVALKIGARVFFAVRSNINPIPTQPSP